MKSLVLLGLSSLAAKVGAHPQRRHDDSSPLGKRGVDLSAFRMPEVSTYSNSNETGSSDPITSIAKRETYVDTAKELVKTVAPNAEFRLIDDHYVGTNGIAHVNFKQTIHGIDVDNADFNVNIGADGKVFSYGNSFYDGDIPEESPLRRREVSDPVDALKGAITVLELPVEADKASSEPKEGDEHVVIKGTSGAAQDPEARLVYFNNGNGNLVLAWRVETDVVDNWLLTYVDANNNEKVHGVVDYVSDLATYQVYPWGLIDPTQGSRVILEEPWLNEASEFGWISDGTSDYTTTQGNNAIAQVNPSGDEPYLDNYRPSNSSLAFEYEYSTSMTNNEDYRDASITQLFYTANKYHDLLYVLGFNEAAGNFEVNNNGQGGQGGDFVILNAQDGSGLNNANFLTPPDGTPGRMRMYMWTYSTPYRDCSFDAGVVIHEYTHGLSNRLTGGPSNTGCLSSFEAGGLGEGWSDFFAITVGLKSDNTRNTDHIAGAWVYNDSVKGIRAYPYSTSLTTNPYTYASADGLTTVHAVGTVWATILYEMLWNLIDKHGKNDGDLPSFDSNGVPTDGKYLALKLVLDGLALQPCGPTFVSARDAILDADKALTGGDNQCELWTAFAKRGLGEGAVYGSKRTQNFVIPEGIC